MCLRNHAVVEELQKEFSTLNAKHERLKLEVKSTEERNQQEFGRLQDEVNELKGNLSRLEKGKYSKVVNVSDYSIPWTKYLSPETVFLFSEVLAN